MPSSLLHGKTLGSNQTIIIIFPIKRCVEVADGELVH